MQQRKCFNCIVTGSKFCRSLLVHNEKIDPAVPAFSFSINSVRNYKFSWLINIIGINGFAFAINVQVHSPG